MNLQYQAVPAAAAAVEIETGTERNGKGNPYVLVFFGAPLAPLADYVSRCDCHGSRFAGDGCGD